MSGWSQKSGWARIPDRAAGGSSASRQLASVECTDCCVAAHHKCRVFTRTRFSTRLVLKIGALHPKLSPSLALESVVIVISTGLVGDYRTAGGSAPSYLACDPCRSSDRTRDRLSYSWWGCQIGSDVPRCDWSVAVEGGVASLHERITGMYIERASTRQALLSATGELL